MKTAFVDRDGCGLQLKEGDMHRGRFFRMRMLERNPRGSSVLCC
jgi:hypothetical protein